MHAAVLLKFTYYAQYAQYAQEQELWSNYYTIYVHVCINNSLHIEDNFRKTVLWSVFMNGIKAYYYGLLYDDCSNRVYHSLTIIFINALINNAIAVFT